jgi:hypothetical protein
MDNRKRIKLKVEDIDTPPVTPEVPEIPEVPETPEIPETPIIPESPESPDVPESPEVPEGEEPAPKLEIPVKPPVDFEEKYKESSREAMSLHFKKEKLESLLSGELDVAEPTEEDLRKYAKDNDADYDDLDTFSKNILKRTLITERKEAKRVTAYEEIKKIDTWAVKVEEFVTSEENITKYPSLEGQEEDFKKFAMKETQRGVDFDLLVGSFLYKNEFTPVKKNKGALFLSRGNGSATPPKPLGISASEASSIRVKDPKRYRQLIKEGKLKILS